VSVFFKFFLPTLQSEGEVFFNEILMYHVFGICLFFLPISQQETEYWEARSHSETRETATLFKI